MASPERHDWYCSYLGWDNRCPVCNPPAMCRNCGHRVLDHNYTPERIRPTWCLRCRGCGSRDEGEDEITLPPPPRRTTQGEQLLVPCRNKCGNRVGGDEVECNTCKEMTRKWENNDDSHAHPREPRPE